MGKGGSRGGVRLFQLCAHQPLTDPEPARSLRSLAGFGADLPLTFHWRAERAKKFLEICTEKGLNEFFDSPLAPTHKSACAPLANLVVPCSSQVSLRTAQVLLRTSEFWARPL